MAFDWNKLVADIPLEAVMEHRRQEAIKVATDMLPGAMAWINAYGSGIEGYMARTEPHPLTRALLLIAIGGAMIRAAGQLGNLTQAEISHAMEVADRMGKGMIGLPMDS